MTSPLRLKRPIPLTALACERIREAIVHGELHLGEQVSEAQLAQRLGVSKTPVREAFLRLKGDGLVEIHPQRGTFVFRLDPAREVHHDLAGAVVVNPTGLYRYTPTLFRCGESAGECVWVVTGTSEGHSSSRMRANSEISSKQTMTWPRSPIEA